jgi:hypothetical protein
MRKAFLTIVGVASLLTAAVTNPTKAEAGCRGCWIGGAVAAGVVGGAIIANNGYGYGYSGYGYGYGYPQVAPPYYGAYAPAYRYGYAPAYYGYAPQYYYPRRAYVGYGYRPYRGYNRYYGPRRYGYRRVVY